MDYNINNYSLDEIKSLFIDEDIKNSYDPDKELIDKINNDILKIRERNNLKNKEQIINFFTKCIDRIKDYKNDQSVFVLDYNVKSEYKSKLVNTNNYKYHNRDIIEKILVIDSKYRKIYKISNYDETSSELLRFENSSSNFSIQLKEPINNVIQIQLNDIEFPNTWYPFSNELGNLTFRIRKKNTDWVTIRINEGVLTYSKLLIIINDKLSENNINVTTSINIERDVLGSNNGQGTINFELINNVGDDYFDLDFFSDCNDIIECQQTLGWALGFRNKDDGFYYNKGVYTSESIVDTVILRYFYIVLNDYITGTISSNIIPISDSMSIIPDTTSILARISTKGALFSNINSEGLSLYSDIRKYPSMVNLSKFDIKIYNEYGKIINLHSTDISFTLKVQIIQNT
jgi:hypothetical protein